MDATWKAILDGAKQTTDDDFANKVSSLTALTDEEIKELTPKSGDPQKLATLLGVVADATKTNQQKADAIRNIAGLAEIAVDVIGKLAKVV